MSWQDRRRCGTGPRRRFCLPTVDLRRPLLGYIRVPSEFPNRDIETLRRAMAEFAQFEGFALGRVLVDASWSHTIAFAELMVALEYGEANPVVVPTMEVRR